jgi:hypothetical protein
VAKNYAIVGTYESSSSQPIRAEGLKPGTYDLSMGGRGMETRSTQVEVRAGQATVVRLLVRNARRVTRANDIALTTGKVVLYTVGFAVYAVVYVALECISGDDDDEDDAYTCPRCGLSACACGPEKKRTLPASVSPYRKK